MSRSEWNRKGKREQPVKFLNARVEDSKLFKEEKKKKEFINCAFTRGFKLNSERSVRSAVSNRLLNSTTNFRLHTCTRHITPF